MHDNIQSHTHNSLHALGADSEMEVDGFFTNVLDEIQAQCPVPLWESVSDRTWKGIIVDISRSIAGGPDELWEEKCMRENPSNDPLCARGCSRPPDVCPCDPCAAVNGRPVDIRAPGVNAFVLRKLAKLERHLIPSQGYQVVGPLQQRLLPPACRRCLRRGHPRLARPHRAAG